MLSGSDLSVYGTSIFDPSLNVARNKYGIRIISLIITGFRSLGLAFKGKASSVFLQSDIIRVALGSASNVTQLEGSEEDITFGRVVAVSVYGGFSPRAVYVPPIVTRHKEQGYENLFKCT